MKGFPRNDRRIAVLSRDSNRLAASWRLYRGCNRGDILLGA
jgi:hypothetical protein